MFPTTEENKVTREKTLQWAKLMFEGEFVLLDTETSNWPGQGGEVIQLGIIDKRGNVLLNTLCKPQSRIAKGAADTHGITDEDVAHAPHFSTLYPYLAEILHNKPVIAYNADFDKEALDATCDKYGLPKISATWFCAMKKFGEFDGAWDSKYDHYKWYKLVEAAEKMGVPVVDAHDATADVKMTLGVMQKMLEPEPAPQKDLNDYLLILFDCDGTLADRETSELLPGVLDWFKEGGFGPHKFAIVSNQGGVGLRYWMESKGFGEPEKYPTEKQAREHLQNVSDKLGEIPYYVCFAYQSKKSGEFGPYPLPLADEWNSYNRKPSPGMLAKAIKDAGVSRNKTLMVGDSDEDKQAAENMGIDFMWANEFFKQKESQGAPTF